MQINNFKAPSPDGVLNLLIGDYHEPNNGRELFTAKLMLDERDVTVHFFGEWPYVNFHLEEYQALSPDAQWMYLPKEGDHFLIHLPSLKKVDLPNFPLSSLNYTGNCFEAGVLVIKTRAGDLRIDLQEFEA
jgi:hypothetical protein